MLDVRKESQVGGEGEDSHGTGLLSWGRPWYVLAKGLTYIEPQAGEGGSSKSTWVQAHACTIGRIENGNYHNPIYNFPGFCQCQRAMFQSPTKHQSVRPTPFPSLVRFSGMSRPQEPW